MYKKMTLINYCNKNNLTLINIVDRILNSIIFNVNFDELV